MNKKPGIERNEERNEGRSARDNIILRLRRRAGFWARATVGPLRFSENILETIRKDRIGHCLEISDQLLIRKGPSFESMTRLGTPLMISSTTLYTGACGSRLFQCPHEGRRMWPFSVFLLWGQAGWNNTGGALVEHRWSYGKISWIEYWSLWLAVAICAQVKKTSQLQDVWAFCETKTLTGGAYMITYCTALYTLSPSEGKNAINGMTA